jgi:hypothetical protein
MTPQQRAHYDNGIWLCAAHAPLVDHDWPRYTVEQLHEMKRIAESKASADLEHVRIQASLRPLLDGEIEWHAPIANETRPGYAGLYHAVFTIGGKRKERGRAYIDVDIGAPAPRRTKACMGDGTDFIAHELAELRPGQPYNIPVFMEVRETTKFWLDRRFVPDHPFWKEPVIATLSPGVYVADEPFLNQLHRPRLSPGRYRIRVAVILGDTEHQQNFYSDWMDVSVEVKS